MTPKRLAEFVERLSYKPDTQFGLLPAEDSLYLTMTFPIVDSNTGTYGYGNASRRLGSWEEVEVITERDLAFVVRGLVSQAEEHEIDEWLRSDGLRFKNPHPEVNPDEPLASFL